MTPQQRGPERDGPVDDSPSPEEPATLDSPRRPWWSALAGVAAVVAGLGASELVAALFAPAASPLLVVGSFVIDIVPGWVKDAVIALFGTADKLVLLVTLAIVVTVIAAAAGVVERSRSPWGRALIAVVGLVGIVAAVTRASAGQLAALPSIVAIVVAVLVLRLLARRAESVRTDPAPSSESRRRFLVAAGVSAGLGILAIVGGRMLTAGQRATQSVRTAFKLPSPATAAPAVPTSAAFEIEGLSPLVTPNSEFYRIDTALQVPVVDPKQWKLQIVGMVDEEISIDFDELAALPLEESYTTLACVSNYVGGDLIGNAKWLGYPIRELLNRARPHSGADMVLSTSVDGFTASSPLDALTDNRNAILALGMNGKPLPFEHGYPVRMVVPGLYGYVSATKWVTTLEVTTFAKHAAYWTERGWSQRGPVKLSSRIDVPRDGGGPVEAGIVTVAGVAWCQHTGISAVQVKVDDGPWYAAQLADAISADTWRQWRWDWPAKTGHHVLTVRATDANGRVQTARVADVVPDGATGLHSIDVTVG